MFAELHAMQAEMEELGDKFATVDPASPEYETIADRYSELSDALMVQDMYSLDSQVGAVLGGLGFAREDWERQTEEFSGGWQMRIALAKLLLQKPSLLAAGRADEPPGPGEPELA